MENNINNIDSILISIKKLLGLDSDIREFDMDIITCINSALAMLNQLGIGPAEGFVIDGDDQTWNDFLGDKRTLQNMAVSYVHLKVRLLFDPPSSSVLTQAITKQLEEIEFRLLVSVK